MQRFFIVFLFLLFGFATSGFGDNYAILITGDTPGGFSSVEKNWNDGKDASYGYDEFWNDTYLMWELLYEYGYTNDHIFVLYGNGSDYNSGYNRYDPEYRHGIQNITDYGAYRYDVDSIFTWLANGDTSEGISQLTSEDNLFIWTFDHGGSSGNNNSTLGLMDGSITDTDFANLVDQIAYNHRVIWMQQCYAGGFIDNLENQNTVIVTSSRGDRLAYRADDYNPDGADQRENELFNGAYYHHGEFDYHMINASRMETIVGNSLTQADQDDNGLMSIAEIWA